VVFEFWALNLFQISDFGFVLLGVFMRLVHFIFLLPAFAALAFFVGCESGAVTSKPKKRPPGGRGEEVEARPVPVTAAQYGTITGKVVYDGVLPELKPLQRGANEGACHADPPNDKENYDETWLVDPATKGVKNAVIILQAPQGKFFDVPEDQQKPKGDVEIDQPRCAFHPRVFVLFPRVMDKATGSLKDTGQKLVILNDAPFEHNYNLITNSDENRGSNKMLKQGQSSILDALQPQAKPVTITCNIHSWMRAYGFILDHPYAAITDKDGNFTIKNAPLGVPLQVVGWHEGAGFFNGGEDGTTKTLRDQEAMEFKVKSR
jgi:hypothetical protein